jgi:hypothetical protein
MISNLGTAIDMILLYPARKEQAQNSTVGMIEGGCTNIRKEARPLKLILLKNCRIRTLKDKLKEACNYSLLITSERRRHA